MMPPSVAGRQPEGGGSVVVVAALHCPVRVVLARPDDAVVRRLLRSERVARVCPDGADRDLLEELADTYRGETVLVLGDVDALLAVVALPGAGSDEPVVLEGDEDGWRRVSPDRAARG